MPIRKDLKHLYGREWREIVRPRILRRAGYRCERCLKPDGESVFVVRYKGLQYWISCAMHARVWRNEFGDYEIADPPQSGWHVIWVHLSVAHMNWTPGDDRDENLKALCQNCHLAHDRSAHRGTRMDRKDSARPLLAIVAGRDYRPKAEEVA